MIGILLITHANLGSELIGAAEFILGRLEQTTHVSVAADQAPEEIKDLLQGALDQVDAGDGVLVLTDMFGGTPNNVSLAFWEEGRVEVVTGVNLPMVIKAASSRGSLALSDLASQVAEAGRTAISSAGEILNS